MASSDSSWGVVDEDAELAGLGEIDEGGEEGGGSDPLVAPRREIGQRRGSERAAQAVADRRDIALVRRLLDRIERGQRAFHHVVLEGLLGEALVRIDPRDHEDRIALRYGPSDKRVLRPQIEHVVLVDPGRHDQERPAIHRLRARRILDQLHQLVLEDDLSGRRGDGLAQDEVVLVRHARREPALVALQIVEHVAQAPQQVLAPGLGGLPERRRVGGEEVGRRQRIDELARVEGELGSILLVEAAQVPHRRLHAGGGQQVRLFQVIEDPALGPGRIAKAPVIGLGRGHRLGRLLALQPLRALLPQPEIAVPPFHLGVDQRRRVLGQAPRHRPQGGAQVERVGHRSGTRRALPAQETRRDPLALLRNGGKLVGHVVFRRVCGGRVVRHRKPCPCGVGWQARLSAAARQCE